MRIGLRKAIAPRFPTRFRDQLCHFQRDDAGTLVIFALMLSVLMLMLGGLAVDVMRYDSRRTSLQNTLDRSTLAGAALNQALDPRDVVDDYFLKAGLQEFLPSVTVTEGLNYRRVTATAKADTQPIFMGMMGIEKFDAPGMSQAEQRVNNVQVTMVLDVSGSMNSNNRMTNLKTAATQFVATVACSYYASPLGLGACSGPNANWNAQLNAMRSRTPTTTMDSQLQQICTAAKAQREIIYRIAFEAPAIGQTQIRTCSTNGKTASHCFNATGLQISTAFSAIANNISQLSLT